MLVSISSVMAVEMRDVTLSLVGVWERLNVTLKAMENLPSSSAESSASRKWASRSSRIASRAVDCSALAGVSVGAVVIICGG